MDTRISKVVNEDGSADFYFEELCHWDYCKIIENILVNENQCSVVREDDMVTDKDVFMRFKDTEFILVHHYMFGNYLHTSDSKDIPILEQLAENVVESVIAKLNVNNP